MGLVWLCMHRLPDSLSLFSRFTGAARIRLRAWLSPATAALLFILASGLALRWHGLDWDRGFGFHPDERDIYMRADCMYQALVNSPGLRACGYLQELPDLVPGLPSPGVFLDPERSPLNPHWFPLGSILIYVLVFLRSVMETVTDLSAFDMRYVARGLSGLADIGSVFLVSVLGRRMYGPKAGLLAAALTALAVVHVQHSHFYRPETFAAFFTLASFWAAFRMMERRRLADSLLLGVLVGLAVAPKVSGVVVMLPVALAYGFRLWDTEQDGQAGGRESWPMVIGHSLAMLLVSALVFFVASPYSLLDFRSFAGDLDLQGYMVRNAGIWPFTVQYVGTPSFFYQFKQTAVFGFGLPLGIVAWLAIPFAVASLFRDGPHFRPVLLVLAYLLAALAILESFEVRFLRYLFTLMPLMILLGSGMLLSLVGAAGALASRRSVSGREPVAGASPPWLHALGRPLRWASVALVVFVVAATAFYSVSFQKVYVRDHPAIEASTWINENVERGAAIVSDNHWDEFVPDLYQFDLWQFPVYEPDTRFKADTLARRLAASEYLLFYSNRPYSSVSRDPGRFPYSARYYQLLFAGDLGYRLERAFNSYPGLWGVEFQDDPVGAAGLPHPDPANPPGSGTWSFNLGYADDNVVGYDHPQVLLFRNEAGLSLAELREMLVLGPLESPAGEGAGPLMLSDSELTRQREGGTWSELFDRESWTNKLPVLAWLLAVELVYLAALPLSVYIFRPLPDRGIVLARILGLLFLSYLAWMLASLGWMPFSKSAIASAFALVSLLSLLALAWRRREIAAFLRERWRLLLGVEALFLLAFLAFVLLRAANPDLWHFWRGGEKPMEMAYLNAVIRSSAMPPYDPWFSGGYLNYYYFGYVIPAFLARVTGIIPTTAFNLAVPLFFALTVTGAFSLVYNIARGVERSQPGELARGFASELDSLNVAGSRGIWPVLKGPVGAGLIGAVFVAVIGNLDGMVQVVQGRWSSLFSTAPGSWGFDFWRSSRMIPSLESFDPSPLAFWMAGGPDVVKQVSPHITEFPFFTFLFADLHAHLMVIPLTLLVLGLGLNLLAGLGRPDLGRTGLGGPPLDKGGFDGAGWPWVLPAVLSLTLALGSLWAVNSWDYPTYLLLVLGLLALAAYWLPGPLRRRVLWAVLLAIGVSGGGILAFLPFHQAYETFNSGLEPSLWRTPLDRYLVIYGLFVFIGVSFLFFQLRGGIRASISRLRRACKFPQAAERRFLVVAGLLVLAFLFFAAAGYWTAAALFVLLSGVGWASWRIIASNRPGRAYAVFPLTMLAMGLGISIGLDLVRITGDIGRMNTLFKYYLEVWVLFGLAAAYMFWRLLGSGAVARMPAWLRGGWLVVLSLLLVSSLIYPVLGTDARLADRFGDTRVTLDGTAYMETAVHYESDVPILLTWDLQAIEWLQDNVIGSPVVLEAHGDQYHWNSRIAKYTGLPTVLGWPWHQIQQRTAYSQEVDNRSRDIGYIYNTTNIDLAEELLRRYQVEYIVVGELERIYYDAAGLQKFQLLEEMGRLERVYQNEAVVIYRAPWG